jgi:hypothetical protein
MTRSSAALEALDAACPPEYDRRSGDWAASDGMPQNRARLQCFNGTQAPTQTSRQTHESRHALGAGTLGFKHHSDNFPNETLPLPECGFVDTLRTTQLSASGRTPGPSLSCMRKSRANRSDSFPEILPFCEHGFRTSLYRKQISPLRRTRVPSMTPRFPAQGSQTYVFAILIGTPARAF